jgi:hypothetical protein
LQIDGLESDCGRVSTIAPFSVTLDGAGSLVIGMHHEGLAEPFRDWLKDGNSPKSGNLQYLKTDLKVAMKVNFTDLSVQTVDPAITTYSSSPAEITLSYARVGVVFPILVRTDILSLRARRR